MRKIIFIAVLILASNMVDAQLWRGYGKGFGIGADQWYNTDQKSSFKNINMSLLVTDFSEKTLICPFFSFGMVDNGTTFYKRDNVTNHTYLWEFGTSVLFELSNHLHVGPRVGLIVDYNRYLSFNDSWDYNVGAEIQYNFDSNFRSLSNKAMYMSVNLRSVGLGFRYYFF